MTLVAALVGGGEGGDHGVRALAAAQQRQAVAAVGEVRVGLRGDRADTGHGRGHRGADGEELAGDGDPVGVTVASDDREGHGRNLRRGRVLGRVGRCVESGQPIGSRACASEY
ncbi:hypothetical protein GCM10025868_43630 [Angustibacter aerolatus]|uniref:Uncharacterized protein n=1 Tax=Angustibacter aerolatus TaxID=1162965 RepID=A0ABQ6JLJ9_9ACTN|nr:hypothetical protein GCM10025868_43630 [Angustibacter aerolatus]